MKFEFPKDFAAWVEKVWPLVSSETINKAEASLNNCDAQLYRVGKIIRIDLKPIK